MASAAQNVRPPVAAARMHAVIVDLPNKPIRRQGTWRTCYRDARLYFGCALGESGHYCVLSRGVSVPFSRRSDWVPGVL